MPAKQTKTNTTASGAGTARAAKPGTPRVTASKHSVKSAAAQAVTVSVPGTAHEEEVREIIASLTEIHFEVTAPKEDPLEAISKLAYCYWEKRGGVAGDALTDWVRAEEEYRRRLTAE